MWCIRRIIKWEGRFYDEYLSVTGFGQDRFVPYWGPISSDYTHFNDYYLADKVLQQMNEFYGEGMGYIEISPDYTDDTAQQE